MSMGMSFLTRCLWDRLYLTFAKEGWTRPKENVAKHPLWSGRGGCFKLPLINSELVWIIGGLKQLPRLRQLRNGPFLYGAATPPSRRRAIRVSRPFYQLDSSAWFRRGGAKRRGGRLPTIRRSAMRSLVCDRPPRPLLSVADTPPVPGGELCSPKQLRLSGATLPCG